MEPAEPNALYTLIAKTATFDPAAKTLTLTGLQPRAMAIIGSGDATTVASKPVKDMFGTKRGTRGRPEGAGARFLRFCGTPAPNAHPALPPLPRRPPRPATHPFPLPPDPSSAHLQGRAPGGGGGQGHAVVGVGHAHGPDGQQAQVRRGWRRG